VGDGDFPERRDFPLLRGLGVLGMAGSVFLPETGEDFVSEIGQKEVREAAEPCLGLGCGNGIANEWRGDALCAVAGNKALLDGKDACGGEAAGGKGGIELLRLRDGIERDRRHGAHGMDN